MAVIVNEIRCGFYLDSVALMRVSKAVASAEGVEEAALMMGTPANKQIMTDAGILGTEGEAAQGGDLVIAIRAGSDTAAQAALAEAVAQLERPRRQGGGESWRPKSISQAADSAPQSSLALISVPGAFAVAEARKALSAGLHVMIFSDNVPIDQERDLKQMARDMDRLVMGPDCGTAIIAGTPLAFANVVPRGDIGIIGASGTGTQEVSCLVAQGGGGISHAIGVGGRDLKEEVGGITTLMALDALDADESTRHVVLISKPPADSVTKTVLARIAQSPKSHTICFIGAPEIDVPDNAKQVFTLEEAARSALGKEPAAAQDATTPSGSGDIVGLFAGGTLCSETQAILMAAGLEVSSNVPIPGAKPYGGEPKGHRLLDLGDDEYTQGRPHPMIDPGVRDAALKDALAAPGAAVVLVDLVLGHGAHADPAGHLIQALGDFAKSGKRVVASVTGTDADPQNRAGQVTKLEAAGVMVAPSNAAATRRALGLLAGER